ncbi:MAG: hypothetical protein ACD_63C00158G0003 [uncultured bacterium]|nr:MAG: hypothetical protein ACD_63C00158G0003 [uncultured bacterium]
MKLLQIITHKKNTPNLTRELLKQRFYVTVIDATGGFTKEKFNIVILGTEDKNVSKILEITKKTCRRKQKMTINNVPIPIIGQEDIVQSQPTKRVKINIGGATIFITRADEIKKV